MLQVVKYEGQKLLLKLVQLRYLAQSINKTARVAYTSPQPVSNSFSVLGDISNVDLFYTVSQKNIPDVFSYNSRKH